MIHYSGRISSVWENKLPKIAVEYPLIRTENISGNAGEYSETTPDEFNVWFPDYAHTQLVLADPDYSVAYIDEVDDVL